MNFKEFDTKVGDILPDSSLSELIAVKNRIRKEINTRRNNSEILEGFRKTREKILEIEDKALSKLKGKQYLSLKKEGVQCSLCCYLYESDVQLMINLGKENKVCSKCVELIKKSIDEN